MISPKEILIDALPIIKEFAPTIAGAIGGPIGMAAGYAVPILASAFDTHPKDLKNLCNNILNDPNASEKLKKLEESHGDIIDLIIDNLNSLSKAEVTIKLEWFPESK